MKRTLDEMTEQSRLSERMARQRGGRAFPDATAAPAMRWLLDAIVLASIGVAMMPFLAILLWALGGLEEAEAPRPRDGDPERMRKTGRGGGGDVGGG